MRAWYPIWGIFFLFCPLFGESGLRKLRIIINSAQETTRLSETGQPILESTGRVPLSPFDLQDQLVVFTGNVSISIDDGSVTATILSDQTVYNTSAQILYSTGNVRYSRTEGETKTIEISGTRFIFELKTLKGLFLDGSLTLPIKGQQVLFVQSPIIHSDAYTSVILKQATLSTEEDPEQALWSVHTKNIWLLPNNQLAFSHGVLSFGVVPLLYIPFFYYPKDEFIGNPVFGLRSRAGAFIQTTTYLLGKRPKSAYPPSFGTQSPAQEEAPNYLKISADYYSALGGMAGISTFFQAKDYLPFVRFSAYIGASRTVHQGGNGAYSIYDTTGQVMWDKSYLFGMQVPFRYYAECALRFHKTPLYVDVHVPIISDPFFSTDFLQRSEDLNWFHLALSPRSLRELTQSTISSYDWKISASLRPVWLVLHPWLRDFSLDPISFTVHFNSKSDSKKNNSSPERNFFYPHSMESRAGLSFSGTLFSHVWERQKSQQKESYAPKEIRNPLAYTPADGLSREGSPPEQSPAVSKENSETDSTFDFFMPEFREENERRTGTDHAYVFTRYALDYKGKGDIVYDAQFNHGSWDDASKIKWNDLQSQHVTIRGDFSIRSQFQCVNDIIRMSNGIQCTLQRRYPIHGQPPAKQNGFQNSALVQSSNNLAVYPFSADSFFRESFLGWSITPVLYDSSPPTGKSSLHVRDHSITANAAFSLYGYTQQIRVSVHFAPGPYAYSIATFLSFPYISATLSARFLDKPQVRAELDFRMPYEITCKQTYVYDIGKSMSDSYEVSLGWKYFSLSYLLKGESGKAAPSGNNGLSISKLKLTLSHDDFPLTVRFWKRRIKIQGTLSSSLEINFKDLDKSHISFSPLITFSIYKFLDLSINTVIKNEKLTPYFPTQSSQSPQTKLWDAFVSSLYFWDEMKRSSALFPIRTLNIELAHYLKDWTLRFGYRLHSELSSSGSRQISPLVSSISLSINWNPLPMVRTRARKTPGMFEVGI
ncbi:LPS-assembly protein LptD [Treponema pallidum]|uniref:LPS-assembly protein LptD n=1 Tax=Treponema pallidum TaxID=160 RepID=UPI00158F2A86|nr:LPS-assembly protein LptD [Treponema pallidum]